MLDENVNGNHSFAPIVMDRNAQPSGDHLCAAEMQQDAPHCSAQPCSPDMEAFHRGSFYAQYLMERQMQMIHGF